VIGTVKFCGLNFDVTDDVLRPYPDAELLVYTSVESLQGVNRPHICDVGTGSANLVTCILGRRTDAIAVAVDISAKALEVAKANTRKFGVDGRIEFIESDVFGNVRPQLFDLIVMSPPYFTDDQIADLDPGFVYGPAESFSGQTDDGLAMTKRFIADIPDFLKPNGVLVLEVNDGRSDAVKEMLLNQKIWRTVEVINSVFSRTPRVIRARTFA